MNDVTVICPYVFDNEIQRVKQTYWELPFLFEKDDSRIGSDLMFEKLWKQCTGDIIIFHADMCHNEDDTPTKWFYELCDYANKYPKAGLIGAKLLYPAKNDEENFWIESAGGKFDEDGNPDHFGSGLDMETQQFFKTPEEDIGQYDMIREVAWTTFGGVYIRRKVLEDVGNFDRTYEWTYNRDVNYCLSAREKGWKIYQVPTRIMHLQSQDNKRIATPQNREAETRNRKRVKKKWQNTKYWKTLNKKINE